jgi:hypothetical protein
LRAWLSAAPLRIPSLILTGSIVWFGLQGKSGDANVAHQSQTSEPASGLCLCASLFSLSTAFLLDRARSLLFVCLALSNVQRFCWAHSSFVVFFHLLHPAIGVQLRLLEPCNASMWRPSLASVCSSVLFDRRFKIPHAVLADESDSAGLLCLIAAAVVPAAFDIEFKQETTSGTPASMVSFFASSCALCPLRLRFSVLLSLPLPRHHARLWRQILQPSTELRIPSCVNLLPLTSDFPLLCSSSSRQTFTLQTTTAFAGRVGTQKFKVSLHFAHRLCSCPIQPCALLPIVLRFHPFVSLAFYSFVSADSV